MTTHTQTPQERIAAMKARAAEKEAAARIERERADRRLRRITEEQEELLSALESLHGIPLLPNGEASADWTVDHGQVIVRVLRKCWTEDQENDHEALIVFGVQSDHDGTYAYLTHDGDVIDLDTALDLATAAVEARFDG
jgi:hypothetical protein